MEKTQQARLDDLYQEVLESGICVELRKHATQIVRGSGNPNADLMFIGEAPGRQEDLLGKPFLGAAGKVLDEMLADNKLDRNDVYITNTVPWRPLNNRDPLLEEKAENKPNLQKEIGIVSPLVIATLGVHALGVLVDDVEIKDVHGKPLDIEVNGLPVTLVPLYHPAAAIYNRTRNRPIQFEDFRHLAEIVRQRKEAA